MSENVALSPATFGDNLPGYEGGDKNQPAVVVIQEWWGVNDYIKKKAAKLVEQLGVRVLIPDLYKGKLGLDKEEAAHLMGNLDFQQAVKEIAQGVKYLKETSSPKVAVIGFCMGGALSLAAGTQISDELAAIVPCYGIPDARYFDVSKIKAPVLGIFGGKDKHAGFSDVPTAEATCKKINDAGGKCELAVFPNAPHGFLNQLFAGGDELVQKTHGDVAPKEEVDAAWAKLTGFLKEHLNVYTTAGDLS